MITSTEEKVIIEGKIDDILMEYLHISKSIITLCRETNIFEDTYKKFNELAINKMLLDELYSCPDYGERVTKGDKITIITFDNRFLNGVVVDLVDGWLSLEINKEIQKIHLDEIQNFKIEKVGSL